MLRGFCCGDHCTLHVRARCGSAGVPQAWLRIFSAGRSRDHGVFVSRHRFDVRVTVRDRSEDNLGIVTGMLTGGRADMTARRGSCLHCCKLHCMCQYRNLPRTPPHRIGLVRNAGSRQRQPHQLLQRVPVHPGGCNELLQHACGVADLLCLLFRRQVERCLHRAMATSVCVDTCVPVVAAYAQHRSSEKRRQKRHQQARHRGQQLLKGARRFMCSS